MRRTGWALEVLGQEHAAGERVWSSLQDLVHEGLHAHAAERAQLGPCLALQLHVERVEEVVDDHKGHGLVWMKQRSDVYDMHEQCL